ncbi:hypothetical protein [Flavobacterium adhaerens]|uniref:hypothetical protein n=1 Tax=Flavobacterium adhaerens TaxID=3149043 RepID=UPI0032B4C420
MEKITAYYESILGIDLKNLNHPISQLISLAKNTTGIEEEQIKQKLRIIGLAFMDIKDYDQKIYDFYIKKTIQNADFSLNGWIFEIIQCSHLIKISNENKMQFKFGDSNKKEPDFIIDGCGIELTSIRFLEESRKNNADSKLLSKFREKNGKDYANANSLLLIEITQIVHFANKSDYQPNTQFNNILKIISNESKFGIVLCYVEYTVPFEDNLHFKGTVYPTYGKDCTDDVKFLFQKITKGEFNTFDGTQSISKY